MKRFTAILIVVLLIFFAGVLAPDSWTFLRCERSPVTRNWLTYVNEAGGYRLRYPEGWKLRRWDAEAYLCSPRINFPCGPTPHEVYATVGVVVIRDTEGLQLAEYLRSPAMGYKDLKERRVGDAQGFATGPVEGDFGRFKSGRFIDEQVHFL